MTDRRRSSARWGPVSRPDGRHRCAGRAGGGSAAISLTRAEPVRRTSARRARRARICGGRWASPCVRPVVGGRGRGHRRCRPPNPSSRSSPTRTRATVAPAGNGCPRPAKRWRPRCRWPGRSTQRCSVSLSTTATSSPAVTGSPSCLSHSTRVALSIAMPIAGKKISSTRSPFLRSPDEPADHDRSSGVSTRRQYHRLSTPRASGRSGRSWRRSAASAERGQIEEGRLSGSGSHCGRLKRRRRTRASRTI